MTCVCSVPAPVAISKSPNSDQLYFKKYSDLAAPV
jgi:hypothetical protein